MNKIYILFCKSIVESLLIKFRKIMFCMWTIFLIDINFIQDNKLWEVI